MRIIFLDKKDLKDYPGAETAAEKFLALNLPGLKYSSNDYSSYAEVLQELGKDSLAVPALEKALELNPDKTDIYKALSSAYSGAKNYDKALEVYKAFIDRGDYVTNDLVTLANRYQNVAATSEPGSQKKIDAINNAIATVDQIIEKVPENPIPYRNKARMMLVKHDNQPLCRAARRIPQGSGNPRPRPRQQGEAHRHVQRGIFTDCFILHLGKRISPWPRLTMRKCSSLTPPTRLSATISRK